LAETATKLACENSNIPVTQDELQPLGALSLRGFVGTPIQLDLYLCLLPDRPLAIPEAEHETGALPAEGRRGRWWNVQDALAAFAAGESSLLSHTRALLQGLQLDASPWALRQIMATLACDPGASSQSTLLPGLELIALRSPTLPPATHTNSFLLGSGELRVLVDPGCPWEAELERLVTRLDQLPRQGASLHEVWLTHHHYDHWASVELLRERYKFKVRAHPLCAKACPPGIVDDLIYDEEVVHLAGEHPQQWELRYAKGHTESHVVFFERMHKSLLAGDHVAGVGTVIVSPPEGDMRDYLETLTVLESFGARLLLPGHGPPTAEVAAKLAFYRAHRLAREDSILRCLERGPQKITELLEEVYAELDPKLFPLAKQSLLAHLIKLEREGRATQRSGAWQLRA